MKRSSFNLLKINKKSVSTVFAVLILSLTVISCNELNGFNGLNEDINRHSLTDSENTGSFEMTFTIPDYSRMEIPAESARLIPPQTDSINLYLLYKQKEDDNNYYSHSQTVYLSKCTRTETVTTETDDFHVYSYSVRFSNIPAGTYEAGNISLSLNDSKGTTIANGSNKQQVTISKDSTPRAEFSLIPTYDYNNRIDIYNLHTTPYSGTVNGNSMTFFPINAWSILSNENILLSLQSSKITEDQGAALFSSNGTFISYFSFGATENEGSTPAVHFLTLKNGENYYLGILNKNSVFDTYSFTLREVKTLTTRLYQGITYDLYLYDGNYKLFDSSNNLKATYTGSNSTQSVTVPQSDSYTFVYTGNSTMPFGANGYFDSAFAERIYSTEFNMEGGKEYTITIETENFSEDENLIAILYKQNQYNEFSDYLTNFTVIAKNGVPVSNTFTYTPESSCTVRFSFLGDYNIDLYNKGSKSVECTCE